MTRGTFHRPLGKPDFSAPNCPVRVLGYCHRYMSEHPVIRKGNNGGKELSAASISCRICTTTVDSHATLQNSKSIPGKVKAHEVCAVVTSLHLLTK